MNAPFSPDDPRLTAYALGEGSPDERAAVAAAVAADPALAEALADIEALAAVLHDACADTDPPTLTEAQHAALHQARRPWYRRLGAFPAMAGLAAAAAVAGLAYLGGAAAFAPKAERLATKTDRPAPPEPRPTRLRPPPSAPESAPSNPNGPTLEVRVVGGRQDTLPPASDPGRPLTARYAAPTEPSPTDKATQDRQADFFNAVPTGRAIASHIELKPGADLELPPLGYGYADAHTGEAYAHRRTNPLVHVADDPRSTFSLDVDTASYSNVRRFLQAGSLPPLDAVRTEELINYFTYDDPEPLDDAPLAVRAQLAPAPWNPDHRLLRIGLKARSLFGADRPRCNLVFLLDVSGSMASPDKLPLVKDGVRLLADNLGPEDTVAIVVYAGASGTVLPPTRGNDTHAVDAALDQLKAGGGTAGAQGIEAAYALAAAHRIPGGINRVILATDGDFNLGIQSDGDLTRLVETHRGEGIYLSVLGVGTGNLKDARMEQLARSGNGQYAYLDSQDEAYRVLTDQVGGTLYTVAEDVKIQVEMNPARVGQWRLIGYENRLLAHAAFNDDREDAGELGAGHGMTALYELVPAGRADAPSTDPLKYQDAATADNAHADEWLTVKLRYKPVGGGDSRLLERPVTDADADADHDLRFAAAVAAFAAKLRGEPLPGFASWAAVRRQAAAALGPDLLGYRAQFLDLIDRAEAIDQAATPPD